MARLMLLCTMGLLLCTCFKTGDPARHESGLASRALNMKSCHPGRIQRLIPNTFVASVQGPQASRGEGVAANLRSVLEAFQEPIHEAVACITKQCSQRQTIAVCSFYQPCSTYELRLGTRRVRSSSLSFQLNPDSRVFFKMNDQQSGWTGYKQADTPFLYMQHADIEEAEGTWKQWSLELRSWELAPDTSIRCVSESPPLRCTDPKGWADDDMRECEFFTSAPEECSVVDRNRGVPNPCCVCQSQRNSSTSLEQFLLGNL